MTQLSIMEVDGNPLPPIVGLDLEDVDSLLKFLELNRDFFPGPLEDSALDPKDSALKPQIFFPPDPVFEDAVWRYLPYLQWFARKLLSEDESYTADDLVQDTLYRACLACFQTQIDNPRAWLCTILLNTFRNYAKRRKTLRAKLRGLDLKDEHRWVLGVHVGDYDDAETVLGYVEDIASLNVLLNELRPCYREIIIEHAILKQDYERLAERMHTTVNALRTRMHRASIMFARLVKRRNIRESDLRRWFLVYHTANPNILLGVRDSSL